MLVLLGVCGHQVFDTNYGLHVLVKRFSLSAVSPLMPWVLTLGCPAGVQFQLVLPSAWRLLVRTLISTVADHRASLACRRSLLRFEKR